MSNVITCPSCLAESPYMPDLVGMKVECCNCGHPFIVPSRVRRAPVTVDSSASITTTLQMPDVFPDLNPPAPPSTEHTDLETSETAPEDPLDDTASGQLVSRSDGLLDQREEDSTAAPA